MKNANVSPDAEAARIAAAYSTRPKAIDYIMGKLAAMAGGKGADLDFISSREVSAFCTALGFEKTWSGRTIEEIARKRSSKIDADDFGPAVIVASEATAILDALKRMITKDHFVGTPESRFDKTILNDFLPRSRAGFEKEPTLGHLWEFQYALQVELEHGRTRGANVTNNHPILTGLVVMAHLSEDTLYYARLWVMESEGELAAQIAKGKKADEIAKTVKETTSRASTSPGGCSRRPSTKGRSSPADCSGSSRAPSRPFRCRSARRDGPPVIGPGAYGRGGARRTPSPRSTDPLPPSRLIA